MEEPEHCPLAKLDAEICPLTKALQKNDSDSAVKIIKAQSLDCCTPAISYFVAPLEKHQFSFQTANEPEEKTSVLKPLVRFEKINFESSFAYRQPLYDYRRARLKNCVFLI